VTRKQVGKRVAGGRVAGKRVAGTRAAGSSSASAEAGEAGKATRAGKASRAVETTRAGETSRAFVVYADGACRGNPGRSGAGAVVSTSAGEIVEELARYLGHATNNIAEYGALILGLEAARRRGGTEVRVRMDSELVVRQVSGRYKVRNPKLRLLHAQVMDLTRSFKRFTIEHVPRDDNAEADRLANQAIDEAGEAGWAGEAGKAPGASKANGASEAERAGEAAGAGGFKNEGDGPDRSR